MVVQIARFLVWTALLQWIVNFFRNGMSFRCSFSKSSVWIWICLDKYLEWNNEDFTLASYYCVRSWRIWQETLENSRELARMIEFGKESEREREREWRELRKNLEWIWFKFQHSLNTIKRVLYIERIPHFNSRQREVLFTLVSPSRNNYPLPNRSCDSPPLACYIPLPWLISWHIVYLWKICTNCLSIICSLQIMSLCFIMHLSDVEISQSFCL